MNIKSVVMFSGLCLSAYACNNSTSEQQREDKTEITHLVDSFTYSKDSATLPGFEIEVQLSKKAEDTLKALHESVIVKAYFSGIPKDTTSEEYEEMGYISIGDHEIELRDVRMAKFMHIALSRKDIELLKDKNFEVLINVFSGHRATDVNLLNVDILQKSIDSVAGKHFVLKGKLIGE